MTDFDLDRCISKGKLKVSNLNPTKIIIDTLAGSTTSWTYHNRHRNTASGKTIAFYGLYRIPIHKLQTLKMQSIFCGPRRTTVKNPGDWLREDILL